MLTMKSNKTLLKYLMGAAALLGLVCPASAEPSATASGTEMVMPASYQALTRYRSYFTELPATDTAPMGFRVTSPERLDPIWRVGAFMSTTGDIAKGDLLVLSMQIRGAGSRPDSAKILFKLQDSSWVGVIREDLDPGTIAHEYEEAEYLSLLERPYHQAVGSQCLDAESFGRVEDTVQKKDLAFKLAVVVDIYKDKEHYKAPYGLV